VVAIACVGLAAPPVASAGDDASDAQMTVSLRLANAGQRPNLLGDLQVNCALFFVNGTSPGGRSRYVFANLRGRFTGAPDFTAGRGEARLAAGFWQVEALPPGRARVRFADLGIELDGRRVYVTARLTRGKALLSGAARQRIGVIRGAKLDDGPLRDRNGREVPSTYSAAVTGQFAMLGPMARALERTRCKGRRNRASRRLPAGYVAGRMTVEVRPARARGLAGTAELTVRGVDPVTVEPAAGATALAPPDDEGRFVAPITSGLPVPLACVVGDGCAPISGTYGVGGGFDLAFEGRRASVANLQVTSTGSALTNAQYTVTGTLNGAPVTIVTGPATAVNPWTDAFKAQAGAALGRDVFGAFGLLAQFTRTAG
jgi:hypothetical protein